MGCPVTLTLAPGPCQADIEHIKSSSDSSQAAVQQQTAKMIAEIGELRRRIAAMDATRERERTELATAQANCKQMRDQLASAKIESHLVRDSVARESQARELQVR